MADGEGGLCERGRVFVARAFGGWLQMRDELIVSADGIFATFQGEGPTMGEPAIFLRLNECNLDCTFCDTAYTWKQSLPEYRERRKVAVETLRDEILACPESTCARLVVTGGEPLLQERQVAQLLALDPFPKWKIEIETNATVVPRSLSGWKNVQLNCSPKLANSGVSLSDRVKPDVLRQLASEFDSNFKFVVREAADVEEIIATYLPLLASIDPQRISVSPEGVDSATLDRVLAAVSPAASRAGFTIGDRAHIRHFGNKRRT